MANGYDSHIYRTLIIRRRARLMIPVKKDEKFLGTAGAFKLCQSHATVSGGRSTCAAYDKKLHRNHRFVV